MTTQLLFYNEVVPISAERHGNWHIRDLKDYSFTNNVNWVPLMAVEFLNASSDFPIVFAGDEDAVMPMLLLGMRQDENVFLASDGSWEGKYIPAFIRRYPFVFSLSEDGEDFFLCIDETYPGFNQDAEGPALIGEDGKASEYTDGVLNFLSEYQAEFQRTQALCKKLKDLNLLERKQVEASLPSGEKMSLTDFYTVDRGRLTTLSSSPVQHKPSLRLSPRIFRRSGLCICVPAEQVAFTILTIGKPIPRNAKRRSARSAGRSNSDERAQAHEICTRARGKIVRCLAVRDVNAPPPLAAQFAIQTA
jgi:hypothetical protein